MSHYDPWTGIGPHEPMWPVGTFEHWLQQLRAAPPRSAAPVTFEQLIAAFERLQLADPEPYLTEIRAQDRATVVHVFNEIRIEASSAQQGQGFYGVPIILDTTEEPGTVRLKFSDGTERTMP